MFILYIHHKKKETFCCAIKKKEYSPPSIKYIVENLCMHF